MKDETRDRRRDLLWALPASLILHGLIVALLVYGLPKSPQQPQQDQAINVALVPPPDHPNLEPAPVLPPKEAKAEKPPRPEKQPPKPASIDVLKPVFQFGDNDTGPRKSLDGGSAQDRSTSPAKNDGLKPSTAAQDAEKQTTEAKDAAAAHDAEKQAAAAPTVQAALSDDGEIALPESADAPQPRPTNVPSPAKVSTSGSGNATGPESTDEAVATSQRYRAFRVFAGSTRKAPPAMRWLRPR